MNDWNNYQSLIKQLHPIVEHFHQNVISRKRKTVLFIADRKQCLEDSRYLIQIVELSYILVAQNLLLVSYRVLSM